MSATVNFSIKYDGPALQQHTMDVRELAPALMALSDLLETASEATFPNDGRVKIHVKGNFKSGSFGVDIGAIQSMSQQIIDMLSGREATAIVNLLELLGAIGLLGGGGLIGLTKFLRGRKADKTIERDDSVVYEVHTTEYIDQYEVNLLTHRLHQTRVVRQHLAKVLRPLATEGIEVFASFDEAGKTQSAVLADELAWFDLSANEVDILSEQTLEGVVLLIESPVFKEGNKWRFSDGSSSFFAAIADQEFLERVNAGQRFGKGDLLVVNLLRVQTMSDSGLRTDYTIEQVIGHKPPPQTDLPLS